MRFGRRLGLRKILIGFEFANGVMIFCCFDWKEGERVYVLNFTL
jgi:hypothetical protein